MSSTLFWHSICSVQTSTKSQSKWWRTRRSWLRPLARMILCLLMARSLKKSLKVSLVSTAKTTQRSVIKARKPAGNGHTTRLAGILCACGGLPSSSLNSSITSSTTMRWLWWMPVRTLTRPALLSIIHGLWERVQVSPWWPLAKRMLSLPSGVFKALKKHAHAGRRWPFFATILMLCSLATTLRVFPESPTYINQSIIKKLCVI